MTRIRSLSAERFSDRLAAATGVPRLTDAALAALHAHHEELARWAGRIDLVGPSAAADLIERHYAESLAALDWLPAGRLRLLDLGSGAGFPGLVLGAVRTDAELWLVEPRGRRGAFLAAAARRMGAGDRVHVVGARVAAHTSPELPDRLDVVTQRALRLDQRDYRDLLPRLAPHGSLLLWEGGRSPALPTALVPARRRLLAGSDRRYLQEYRLEAAPR